MENRLVQKLERKLRGHGFQVRRDNKMKVKKIDVLAFFSLFFCFLTVGFAILSSIKGSRIYYFLYALCSIIWIFLVYEYTNETIKEKYES